MPGPPEIRLVVRFEDAPYLELHASDDEALDRLVLWLATPRAARHLRTLVRLLTGETYRDV